MEKEENRRPQHFLFSFEMKGESERQRETKKEPYLDTLDALILCDLLQLKKGAFMDEMPQLNRIALQQSELLSLVNYPKRYITLQYKSCLPFTYINMFVSKIEIKEKLIGEENAVLYMQFNHCYCLMFLNHLILLQKLRCYLRLYF